MIIEKSLIEYCSPTLCRLKTASLFSIRHNDSKSLYHSVESWNNILITKGIKLMVLKENNKFALIYMYREDLLKEDFNNNITQNIMKTYGYNDLSNINEVLDILKDRLTEYEQFPHEIGLFLGYPPNDVLGFIKYKGKNYEFCVYWKVYSELECSLKKFRMYDKCKKVYEKMWQAGNDVLRLAVA